MRIKVNKSSVINIIICKTKKYSFIFLFDYKKTKSLKTKNPDSFESGLCTSGGT